VYELKFSREQLFQLFPVEVVSSHNEIQLFVDRRVDMLTMQHRALQGVHIAIVVARSFYRCSAWIPQQFHFFSGDVVRERQQQHPQTRVTQKISASVISTQLFFSSMSKSSTSENVTTASTTSVVNESEQKLDVVLPNVPIGGDYAGYLATYDPNDGSFIPVPEHFIPAALLEWGQEPSTLEVLVSEDVKGFDIEEIILQRQITTLFPEIGCSIDNIETKKTFENIKMSSIWQEKTKIEHITDPMSTFCDEIEGKVVAQQSLQFISEKKFSIETIFGCMMMSGSRIRIKFDYEFSSNRDNFEEIIKNPISIILERQVSTNSTCGTIADGGGLDGRSVAGMIGPSLRKYSDFPNIKQNMTTFETIRERLQSQNSPNVIHFPGTNITFSSFYDEKNNIFVVEVGQIILTEINTRTGVATYLRDADETDVGEGDNPGDEFRYYHYVVRRMFHLSRNESRVQSTLTKI
jgi:hypothetical protein